LARAALVDKIVANLRAEVKALEEEEIYERARMKGSQIGLELQPPTSDIDKIMRSMMSTGFSLSGPPAESSGSATPNTNTHSTVPFPSNPQPPPPRPAGPISDGPWKNYGHKPASLPLANSNPKSPPFALLGLTQTSSGRSTTSVPTSSFASSTTAGTNSRTSVDGEEGFGSGGATSRDVLHGLRRIDSSTTEGSTYTGQGQGAGRPRYDSMEGMGLGGGVGGGDGTIVGGKRTRSGTRRVGRG